MRVGFIGLGNQGTPIAERIAGSGRFEFAVWARRAEPLARFRGGSTTVAASPAELGDGLDLLVTCVFDAAQTREVLFGENGAAVLMPPGAIVMCHSTVSPREIIELGAEADRLGLRLLDAPVTGGAPKAAAGELAVMVGGDEAAYRAAVPVLETYSNLVVHLGDVGAGQQAKLLNNAMLAAHLGIAHDVFEIAETLGLDTAGLGQILRQGSGRSFGLEVYAGHGALEPMTRGPLHAALTKDVGLLGDVLADRDEATVLLPPARKFVADLTRIADRNSV